MGKLSGINSVLTSDLLSGMRHETVIIRRMPRERKLIVRVLWTLLVDDLVRAPILELGLIGRFHGIRLSWRRSQRILLRLRRHSWVFIHISIRCLQLNVMRVQYFMFFFYIEILRCLLIPDHFHSVVFGVLSLVVRINAFWVFVLDQLVYLLSPTGSTHIILIVLDIFVLQVFGCLVKGVS